MSVASTTGYDGGTKGIVIGLHQTDRRWVFRGSAGTATSTELKTERFDVGARPNH